MLDILALSEKMMIDLFIEDLPSQWADPVLASCISMDFQLYGKCNACGHETRLEMLGNLETIKSKLILPCFYCGQHGMEFVRHVMRQQLHCKECALEFQSQAMSWEGTACPGCRSRRLELIGADIEPPFPQSLGIDASAVGFRPIFTKDEEIEETPWGVSGRIDSIRLNTEWERINDRLPNPHKYLGPLIGFCGTLSMFAGYPTSLDFFLVRILQGNFLQYYFKATRRIEAGLQAISRFKTLQDEVPDPINRALLLHSFAMAVFSFLALCGEGTLAILLARPTIRRDAITAAEEAQDILVNLRRDKVDARFVSQQIARIKWIIADLLRIGRPNGRDLRRATKLLGEALRNDDVSDSRGYAIRQSRVECVLALTHPSAREMKQMALDVAEVLEADQSTGAIDNQFLGHFAIARMASRSGDRVTMLRALDRSSAEALAQITAMADEQSLFAQTERVAPVFDELALAYASVGWVDEALGATEILRGLTVRLHLMGTRERSAMADESRDRWRERLGPPALRQGMKIKAEDGQLHRVMLGPAPAPSQRRIERYLEEQPIGPVVKSLLNATAVESTALVSLTLHDGKAMALVCTRVSSNKWRNEARTWSVRGSALGHLHSLGGAAPTPYRENLLRQICRCGLQTLIAPIEDLLASAKVTRLLLSVPGQVCRLPYEAFAGGNASLQIAGRDVSCVLLPSIRMAENLSERTARVPPRTADELRVVVVPYAGTDLPHIGGELKLLQDTWGPDRLICVQEGHTTKHEVLDALSGDFDVLHIMGHAIHHPTWPLRSAIHLTADHDSDINSITAEDLMSVPKFKRAPVIILSACSSAVTASTLTNTYHGLAGALLRLGAKGIVGSRWAVYDDVAAEFMSELHSSLSGGIPAHESVRRSQAKLRASAHPVEDWAAFFYIGIP